MIISEEVMRTTSKVQETFQTPFVISQYTYMRLVDCSDHYSASYALLCKIVKWWWKMFFWQLSAIKQLSTATFFSDMQKKEGRKPMVYIQFWHRLLVEFVDDI